MTDHNAGNALLQIIPTFRGVAEAIDQEARKWGLSAGQRFASTFNDEVRRQTNNAPLGPSAPTSTRQGQESAGRFADGFKTKIDAALRSLPPVRIGVAATEAEQKLKDLRVELEELSKQRIGIDLTDEEAIAKVDALKDQLQELARTSPSVSVRMDTAAAAAQLERLKADIEKVGADDPTVDVNADTAAATGKLVALKAALADVAGDTKHVNVDVVTGPALAGIAAIKSALLTLSAGAVITPLIGGVASLLGPLAAVGLGGAGVAGASLPGLNAVKNALTAQSAAQKAVAGSAGESASTQVSAANQIKSAELSLADTERRIANDRITSAEAVKTAQQGVVAAQQSAAQQIAQANQQVTTAEQSLANAQRASLAAQQALTDARNAATRSLQDQAFAATDAGLQLEQDQLAVQQAQANLDAVNANSTSTDLQKQQAALALKEAQQALVEQQVTLQRATDDNNKAQAAGVDGSKQVVSAQNGVTSANKAVSDATTALAAAHVAAAQAQVQAQQKVAQAEKTLSDARRAQALQAAQDASSLVQAHMAVEQAQLAAASSSSGSATAANRLAAAMAALTPQEAALVAATTRFKATFKDFGRDLEPVTLPLFTGGLGILTQLLPKLEPLIRATAGALGQIEKSVSSAINGPGFSKFLATLTGLVGPALNDIAGIGGNLAGVFAHIVEAFAPLSGVVLGGLKTLTGELNKATQSPALAQFVHLLVGLAPQILSTFSSVGGTIGAIVKALAPLAGPVLSVIKTLADALSRLVGDLAGPFSKMFAALAPIINELIAKLLPPLTKFLTDIAGQVPALAQAFSDVVQALLPLLPIIADLLKVAIPVLDFLSPLAPLIVAVVVAIKAWEIVQAAINILLALNPIGLIVIAIAALVAGIILAYKHSETFRNIVHDTWDVIKEVVSAAWEKVLKPVFSALASAFESVGSAATTAFDAVKTAWGDVRDFLAKEWKTFAGTAGKLWDSIAGAIGTAFGAVKSALSTVWTDVEKVFAGGVNFVTQDILNPLIGILNDVLGIFGVHIGKISKITVSTGGSGSSSGTGGTHGGPVKNFALGGTIPGYSPGVDNVLIPTFHFSGGEGILVPEATRALGGADGIQAINAMFSNRVSMPGHFAGGGSILPGGIGSGTAGAVGGVGDLLGGLGSTASGIVGDIGAAIQKVKDLIREGAADAAMAALRAAEAPIRAIIGTAGTPFANKLASGVFNKLNDSVYDFLRGHVKKPAAAGSGGGTVPTGEHLALIQQALVLAGVLDAPANEAAVNTIVTYESGWNANAINLTDSNAAAGHPSQGLMQTIPGTFEAYRLASLPDVITDPLANLVAGIRYAVSRYGSLENVPGVVGVANGTGYVGYDSGGYLPPGLTTVYNGTGRPEPVLTPAQLKDITNRPADLTGVRGDLAELRETVAYLGDRFDQSLQQQARTQQTYARQFAGQR